MVKMISEKKLNKTAKRAIAKQEIPCDGRIPYIHYDRVKRINGKTCYQAEITDNAGTHGILIRKEQSKKILIRNTINRREQK